MEDENVVTTSTIRLFMRAYVEVLNNTYVPLQKLKTYEKRLARFGRDITEDFESLWYRREDEGEFEFQYPFQISETDATWRSIRDKHYQHLDSTMTQIGCTDIEDIPEEEQMRLVELVGTDLNENLASVRSEIQSAEERLVRDTEAQYGFCREHLRWSEAKIYTLGSLGEEFFDTFVACKRVEANNEEIEDLFAAGALFVNGDEEALTNFAVRFTQRRGRPVTFMRVA
jgi:hypothetical protein